MIKVTKRTGWLIAGLALTGVLSSVAPAAAQSSCQDPRIGQLPNGCQKDKIQASGNLRFLSESAAQASGEGAWKREVLTKFGERFTDWKNATCKTTECVPGAISGTKRCTYAGYPCAKVSVESGGYGSGELEESQVRRIQRWLGTSVDGKWGRESSEALQRWQRKRGLDDDGLPTKENYERLAKFFER